MSQEFNHQLYGYFARIGKAVSNGHRIALLDLLGQGERSVEMLAKLAGLSTANTSQHLQQLRNAGLVKARKQGQHVFYRLTDDLRIAQLLEAVQTLAQDKLTEVGRLVSHHLGPTVRRDTVSARELAQRLTETTVIDVRPAEEYVTGHIPGANNIELRELERRLGDIPDHRDIVIYCRGAYSLPAVEATERLRKEGFQVQRLKRGFTEWRLAGLPVEAEEAVNMALA